MGRKLSKKRLDALLARVAEVKASYAEFNGIGEFNGRLVDAMTQYAAERDGLSEAAAFPTKYLDPAYIDQDAADEINVHLDLIEADRDLSEANVREARALLHDVWNHLPPEMAYHLSLRLQDHMRQYGVEVEDGDEYMSASDMLRAVRFIRGR